MLSVILPNYNHGEFIAATLDALVNQTRPADEIIIVDDGSTDNSVDIIEGFLTQNNTIRLIRSPINEGAHAAVYKALQEVKGDFLYFAAADDEILPGLFEQSLNLLEAHPEAGACTSLASDLSPEGHVVGEIKSAKVCSEPAFIAPDKALKLLYRHNNWFMCNTAIYRRAILDGLGGFDPKLITYTDSFTCSIIALRHGICFIPLSLGAIRRMETNYSAMTVSNIDTAEKMFNYARQLMETTYREIFPDDYVNLWDRRWRYAVASNLIGKGRMNKDYLTRLFPSATALDKLICSALPKNLRLLDYFLLGRLTPVDFLRAVKGKFSMPNSSQ